MDTDNIPPWSFQVDNWIVSALLRVTVTSNIEKTRCLVEDKTFIHVFYNGDMKADRKWCQAASLSGSPVSLHQEILCPLADKT